MPGPLHVEVQYEPMAAARPVALRAEWGIARLILLNGPPGVGKSTCARLWAAGRTGSVVVEVDELRVSIEGWQHDDRSKLDARRLALEHIDRHLRSGADVMVPQYLGRTDFIEELERTARAAGAVFVEIRLTADEAQVVRRFEDRRADGALHPEHEVQDVPKAVAEAVGRLADLATTRPPASTVAAGGNPTVTAALVAAELDP